MRNAVIIKSFHNGIAVYLDDRMAFRELLKEVVIKFRESDHFFRDAKMAISFEGRKLSGEEERLLIMAIQDNSKLNIVCLVGKNEDTEENFLKSIERLKHNDTEEGHFYRGTLRFGQVLETESSIIVVGDVSPGAEIISTRDIIILGALYGEAYAGGNGSKEHYVVALEMAPESIKIGDFKYMAKEKSRWGRKPRVQPKIAYVNNGRIIMEPLTKELLNDLPL